MKISAQMTVVMAAIFAVICYGVAITGFLSLGDIADATQKSDAKGFAWFWALAPGRFPTLPIACSPKRSPLISASISVA